MQLQKEAVGGNVQSVPLNFQGNWKENDPSLLRQRELAAPLPGARAGVGVVRMRASVAIPTGRRCAAGGGEAGEPGVQAMETQISPKAEGAEVAKLELEAAIGFNGEASGASGLGGLQALGTRTPNRDRGTPGGTWKAAEPWQGPSSLPPQGPGESHPRSSLQGWGGFTAPRRDKCLLTGPKDE